MGTLSAPIRVLWAVNVPLPAAAPALGLPASPFGGWLSTMTQRLSRVPGMELAVAMRSPVPQLRIVDVDGIRYYALPQVGKGGLDARPEDCKAILEEFRPDLLHAEGSEMAYTRRMLEAWQGPRLLSLQGVVNGIAPHYLGGLESGRWSSRLRPAQQLAILAMRMNRRLRFLPRLQDERATLAMATHLMGRTPWDRAHAWALNPQAKYHHCGRSLREAFTGRRWTLDGCRRHSLFVGNSAVALKGIHVLLDAMRLLLPHFPDLHLFIAGSPPTGTRLRPSQWIGYPAYLRDRIRELRLDRQITFTGVLDADGMAERMASCHVFVMSSLIENSPNTLGEAMMLGMPCISAHAGGAPGMAQDEKEALFYRAEDPVILAHQLKRLFDSDTLCMRLGEAAHARALQNHDPERNLQDLLRAYREILQAQTP